MRSDCSKGVVKQWISLGSQDPVDGSRENRLHLGSGFRSHENPDQHLKFIPRYERFTSAPESKNGQSNAFDAPLGWLICGYGPFRRISTSIHQLVPETENLSNLMSRVVTLFDDRISLSGGTGFLPSLFNRQNDVNHPDRKRAAHALKACTRLLNFLLPSQFQVADVNSERVLLCDTYGNSRSPESLSDGFRSFLALAFDLLRHAYERAFDFAAIIEPDEEGDLCLKIEGIVLIDEADAHLHPRWQRELAHRLTRVFPKMQFIVSTHSPFIAQEATAGGLFVLKANEQGTVEIEQPLDTVQGWPVSQILTSPLFGLESTRDPETEELIRKHADLSARKQFAKLSPAQTKELKHIAKVLEKRLTAPGESLADSQTYEEKDRYVAETLRHLKNGQ